MPAINFQQGFGLPIRTGLKVLTMRVPRADGRTPGMAEVGRDVNLYTGLRTKAARLEATVLVTAIAEVTFGPGGFEAARTLGPLIVIDARDPGVMALLDCADSRANEAARDRLARLDGFETWAGLWQYHSEVETKRHPQRRYGAPVTRHMVIWRAPVVR